MHSGSMLTTGLAETVISAYNVALFGILGSDGAGRRGRVKQRINRSSPSLALLVREDELRWKLPRSERDT